MSSSPEVMNLIHTLMVGKLDQDAAKQRQQRMQKASRAQLINMEIEFNALMQTIQQVTQQNLANQQALDDALKARMIAELNVEVQKNPKISFNNFNEAINEAQSPYKSLLEEALDNQDFTAASILIDNGAAVGPAEREAFKMASISQAAEDFGIPQPRAEERALPPIKKYGLVLGVRATAQDGTFSQKAFLGDALKQVTSMVHVHARESNKPQFKKIAEAFGAAKDIGRYNYSTPGNANAGHEMKARIMKGKVTSIPIRRKGHTMGLSVVPGKDGGGYVVFTNRGSGATPNEKGTQIYKVDDLSKLDPVAIQAVMSGRGELSHEQCMGELAKLTGGGAQVMHIPQDPQTVDNCTVANPTSNVEGMLVAMKAIELDKDVSELSESELSEAKGEFKDFADGMEARSVESLTCELAKDPTNTDLRTIATAYLEQRPDADPKLREAIQHTLDTGSAPEVEVSHNLN